MVAHAAYTDGRLRDASHSEPCGPARPAAAVPRAGVASGSPGRRWRECALRHCCASAARMRRAAMRSNPGQLRNCS
eukprot:12048726-Heterocapsa_arctica.AAC.1